MRGFLIVLWLAGSLLAQPPDSSSRRLQRARRILAERHEHLVDYVCSQTVDRHYFKHRHAASGKVSCNDLVALSEKDLELEATDRLRLDVKLSQREEIGSWAGSQFSERSIFDLVGGGGYQTGALGTTISDVFLNDGASYRYVGDATSDGTKLSQYSYQVPIPASHLQIWSGNHWILAPFSGSFWLNMESAELSRITIESSELPEKSGGCLTSTTVDYRMVSAGSGKFLLPVKSTTRMVSFGGRETHISAAYAACREYQGEATIHFDDLPGGVEIKAAAAPPLPLPPGLPLSLALAEPIDTDTAAAGDIVRAKLRGAVHDPKTKTILIPKGGIVQARIVRIYHALSSPSRWEISLILERLHGTGQPIHAKPESQEPLSVGDVMHGTVVSHSSAQVLAVRAAQSLLVADLLFITDQKHYRVPAGYATDWVTVEPSPSAR